MSAGAPEGESDVVDALEDAGLLTRRQAQAFLLRHHTPLTRQQAADELGISVGVFDDHRAEADRKVEAARATVDVLDDLEGDDELAEVRMGRRQREAPVDDPPADAVDEPVCSDCEPLDDALDCGHESDDAVDVGGGSRVCPECAGVDVDGDDPLERVEELAADLELPGSGDVLEERREAVVECARYLRDRSQAQKSDFQADVFPDHDGRYNSPGGWWNAIGKQGLRALADDVDELEAPAGEGAHDWYWLD